MIRADRNEVLRYLGYAGQPMDEDFRARFDRVVDECEREAAPRYVRAVFQLDREHSDENAVVLAGCGLVLEGFDIVRHLNGAQEAVLLACTLGEACERGLRRRKATSPADALMYDAAASALVEAVANETESAAVEEAMARGLRTNFRFSPGYGDFPLQVQRAFLDVLDAPRRIGLSATPDCLLVPTKSVTAVIGLFRGHPPNDSVRSACSICTLRENCALRAQGRTCHG